LEKEQFQNIELIEADLEGRLTDEENHRVESLLASDSDFKNELILYQTIISGVRSEKDEHLVEEFRKIDRLQDVAIAQKPNIFFSFNRIAAVVLIICIASTTLYFYSSREEKSIAASLYVDDPGLPVKMSVNDQLALDNAMSYYKTGNYNSALEIINQQIKLNPTNDTLQYYMGVVLIKTGKFEKSIQYFTLLIDRCSTTVFCNDAEYRLGMAYWFVNDMTNAKRIFLKIEKDTLHPYFDPSTKALAEINKGVK